MTSNGPRIGAWSVAVPPFCLKQAEAENFLMENYGADMSPRARKVLGKVFNHPSVQKRYFGFEQPAELVRENPDSRMERFTRESLKLSVEATRGALSQAGLHKDEISAVVLNTCTGYICPGLSTYLVEALNLKRGTRTYDLVGSGCGGAIPNLQLSRSLLKDFPEGKILSVSVEICSATFQMKDDLSLIISNAIFGDGAAAAILWNQPRGLSLIDSVSHHVPEYREDIRFVYKDGQLHNQLSSRLPELAGKAVGTTVNDLLRQNSLRREDISHWVIHPGGENIIAAVQEELGLSAAQIHPTRNVLANFGNMSSATVWFILDHIRESIKPDEYMVMLAFGAGFTAHAFLLKS
jgi:predicted naringenin-chalcone synthase